MPPSMKPFLMNSSTIAGSRVPNQSSNENVSVKPKHTERTRTIEPVGCEQGQHPPLYQLNEKHMKVVAALFRVPIMSQHPNRLDWKEFVDTMYSFGFDPEHSKKGCKFVPSGRGITRGLAGNVPFHYPHKKGQKPTVSIQKARDWGSDLSKAYGWKGDMFTDM
jgi:hypothetical protein